MRVRDAMSSPVVTVPVDVTLREAAAAMSRNGIGCVLVTAEAEEPPRGILTESDALRAAGRRDVPLSSIPVREVASHPLVTVQPHRTLGYAVDTMVEHGVKRLPVVDGMEAVGIVTLTDIALRHDEIKSEGVELGEARKRWG